MKRCVFGFVCALALLSLAPAALAAPTCFGREATIVGSPGKDRIRGTAGVDVIVGRGGNDRIRDRGGNDFVCSGKGNDTVISGGGAERYSGGPGRDYLSPGSGPNVVFGGPGHDTLNPHRFGGRFVGGRGVDTATFFQVECGVAANLARGRARWACASYRGKARLLGFENLAGSARDDRLIGNRRNNEVFGNRGNDVLKGGAGRDILIGFLGNDRLSGGPNRDGAWFHVPIPRAVRVDLEHGVASGHGRDRLSGIEDVYGSFLSDRIIGSSGRNRLFGAEGNDDIFGRDGVDLLQGDVGVDFMNGGGGIDECNQDGNDPPPTSCETITATGARRAGTRTGSVSSPDLHPSEDPS